MRKTLFLRHSAIGLAAILLFTLTGVLASSPTAAEAEYIPGQLIIQIAPTKSASDLTDAFSNIGLKQKKVLSRRLNIYLFEYDTQNLKSAGHDRILYDVRLHPAVERGQFNHRIEMRATTPNDPSFTNQWALNNTGQTGGTSDADIDAPEAWDLATSGTTATGDQIVVAIVDGGCDLNHSDIDYFKNTNEIPGNGIDDDGNGYVDDYDGWDAYASDGSVPSSDHGTHVAGIAAAIGNNNNGVSGVNWNVKVMPIAGSTNQEAVAVEAYGYALEMRAQYNESDGALGAFVVSTNSSFGVDYGDPDNFPIWCAMYDSMGAYGVLSAAATANIGMDIDVNGDVPTACPSDFLLSVTNTTDDDVKNTGAGYGLTTIDLGAPGTSVYSCTQGGGYGYKTGTSMATPHVAGAVAFMYSVATEGVMQLAKQQPDSVARLVKKALMDGVDILSSLDGSTVSGGRLNLFNSAQQVLAIPTGATITHTPLPDTRDTLNNYEVVATIQSDTALIPDSLQLHYEVNSVWTMTMLSSGAGEDEYVGIIPAQPAGTDVSYYLYAMDEEGDADTTETYTFRVLDYGLSITPDTSVSRGAVADTLWYPLRVTNVGVLADTYNLSASSPKWPALLFDETGTTQITQTTALTGDDYFDFLVRVIVPISVFGNADTATVVAESQSDPSYAEEAAVITISDGEPVTIPLVEEFPDPTFDAAHWVSVVGATVNTDGLSEPSAPYSANLDGSPSGRDTLMSQAIDLKNETSVIVKYYYQRTGGGNAPEAGDDLFVEYLDSTDNWVLIQQHLGAGEDMITFEEVSFSLPGEAMHSSFRLRFRCTATTGDFDDWFVDDIFVGEPPPYDLDLQPNAVSQYAPAGDTITYELEILNKGTNSDSYELAAFGNEWPIAFFDSAGVLPIVATNNIAPGERAFFQAKVAIPETAGMNVVDTATIHATSNNDNGISDMSFSYSTSVGPPGGFPWYENFPEDTLISLRWMYNSGAEVVTSTNEPPSPPYVLLLDGEIDTVVTQVIDLSTQTEALLSFYYMQGGAEPPDDGDDLWVEYRTAGGTWVEADHLYGADPTMSSLVHRIAYLGPDAFHANFQLRLRSFGNCVDCDFWYVDDIRLDFAPDVTVEPASFSSELLTGDSANADLIIGNVGDGGLDYSLGIIPTGTFLPLADLADRGELQPARRTYPEGFDDISLPKGAEDTRVGLPVERNAGGPDAFGYFWIDSDEPGGPAFDWVDVSATGTNIVAQLDDDNYAGPFELGFSFPFYDSAYSRIYISSNGLVGFDPVNLSTRSRKPIPNDSVPNAILAWLWDDLDPTNDNNANAAVYVDTTGGRCVIQFVDYPEYLGQAGDVINAEVILEADGTITFQYLSIPIGFDVASSTVGIENPTGTDGLEVAYLTPYLKDSLAITFLNPYQWLSIQNASGSIAPGETDTIAVKFNAAELDSGLYQARIVVACNDPDERTVNVPADLTVITVPPYICGDVDNSGSEASVSDLTYLVDYLFRSGPAPPVLEAADMNGSGGTPLVSDLTYLVDYLFRGGPPPICGG